MDRETTRALLADVANGDVDVDAALQRLVTSVMPGFADLGFARLDTTRALRTGDPEVIYGAGKTPDQIVTLLQTAAAGSTRATLVTRLSDDAIAAIKDRLPTATIDVTARAATLGELPPQAGNVVVVSAGTSDEPIAAEAALTAQVFGAGVTRVCDAGVAGLHRLLAEGERLAAADCIIAVAGMEGALPSVIGGLVGVPVIATPTSVGYGASFDGLAALLAMLNSCAPGVCVVNIDNGFGAGVAAARIARQTRPNPAAR